MKQTGRQLFLLFSCIWLVSCGARGTKTADFDRVVYAPRYAAGYSICANADGQTLLRVENPWQGARDTQFDYVLAKPVRRVVCMSSSHVAMLAALGASDRVKGVSGVRYLTQPIEDVQEVGYEGAVDYETLVALKPDVVLLYGVQAASPMETKLRALGIPYIYIGDYVERSPLGKAEWMVAIGELIGRRERAEREFGKIAARYEILRKSIPLSSRTPRVMTNLPYSGSWFVPAADSYQTALLRDAGAEPVYAPTGTTSSESVDLERAYELALQADYWINTDAAASIADLPSRFRRTPAVMKDHVWNNTLRINTGGGNDYWESGVVRPDAVLSDLIRIFHPGILPDSAMTYYRRLR